MDVHPAVIRPLSAAATACGLSSISPGVWKLLSQSHSLRSRFGSTRQFTVVSLQRTDDKTNGGLLQILRAAMPRCSGEQKVNSDSNTTSRGQDPSRDRCVWQTMHSITVLTVTASSGNPTSTTSTNTTVEQGNPADARDIL